MEVKIKKLSNNATIPVYGTPGAACFDVYPIREEYIAPGKVEIVATGLAFEVPEDHVLLLFSRSGNAKRGMQLANCVGVIDSDYRGELKVMVRNMRAIGMFLKPEKACAQAMIMPVSQCQFNVVDELSSTDRDDKGFGSTDK